MSQAKQEADCFVHLHLGRRALPPIRIEGRTGDLGRLKGGGREEEENAMCALTSPKIFKELEAQQINVYANFVLRECSSGKPFDLSRLHLLSCPLSTQLLEHGLKTPCPMRRCRIACLAWLSERCLARLIGADVPAPIVLKAIHHHTL